jgi:hypothetical protein
MANETKHFSNKDDLISVPRHFEGALNKLISDMEMLELAIGRCPEASNLLLRGFLAYSMPKIENLHTLIDHGVSKPQLSEPDGG